MKTSLFDDISVKVNLAIIYISSLVSKPGLKGIIFENRWLLSEFRTE